MVRGFIAKYRGILLLNVTSSIVASAVAGYVERVLSASPIAAFQLALMVFLVGLSVGQIIIMRRSVIERVRSLTERVDIFAGARFPTQFDERTRHYAFEKNQLARELVHNQLPSLMGSCAPNQDVAIVVDAGTTLQPFFSAFRTYGLGQEQNARLAGRVALHTNSFSGCIAFCDEEDGAMSESQMHLFGGTPMAKYRAVLGAETVEGVKELSKASSRPRIVGLLTANWILVGQNCDRLIICARELSHLEYKVEVARSADLLIVVAPLGKIAQFNDVTELNRVLSLVDEGAYHGHNVIDGRRPEDTFLLTTRRTANSSPLFNWSHHVQKNVLAARRFKLWDGDRRLVFNPEGTKDQIENAEFPHVYVREHKAEFYDLFT